MACYVHHVPGRLRIKTVALKNNLYLARHAKSCLEKVRGVLEAAVSTITGSIVIKYDACLVSSTTILNTLRDQGYIQNTHCLTANQAVRRIHPAQKVADTLVAKLIETAVERSAVALIAAVL
jgi:copper chaperone CopZ